MLYNITHYTMFRKLLHDLKKFLSEMHGVVIGEQILVHMLWADDLILLSDTKDGLQKQINGLETFCKKFQMIVNAMKTKVMIIGSKSPDDVFTFNEEEIEICDAYKYLGVIFNPIQRVGGNMFRDMIDETAKKGLRALFGVMRKCKSVGRLSPKISMNLFDTFVLPVLEYGCEVWAKGMPIQAIEGVQLKFLKMTLGVKKSTATAAVYSETGRFPLYLRQKVRIVKYWIRLERLGDDSVVKVVFDMLKHLDSLGHKNWFSNVRNILESCSLEKYLEKPPMDTICANECILELKEVIFGNFMKECMNSFQTFPILRTYKGFKKEFKMEAYLTDIIDFKIRKVISRFRLSSHSLPIEKGRHCKPVIPAESRFCNRCIDQVVGDEYHFLLVCPSLQDLRETLLNNIRENVPELYYAERNVAANFNNILMCKDVTVMFSIGKFLQKSFERM